MLTWLLVLFLPRLRGCGQLGIDWAARSFSPGLWRSRLENGAGSGGKGCSLTSTLCARRWPSDQWPKEMLAEIPGGLWACGAHPEEDSPGSGQGNGQWASAHSHCGLRAGPAGVWHEIQNDINMNTYVQYFWDPVALRPSYNCRGGKFFLIPF